MDADGGGRRGQLAFLAETSRCLAESLEYETTLLTVAGRALPFLGSWCIVDLVEPNGGMRRLGVVHPDPEKQKLVAELKESWPPAVDDPLGVPLAVRSRRVEVIPHVPDEMLRKVARDPENLRILRALGIGSVIVVPLLARGAVLGALTLVSSDTGHQYAEEDLALAEDLGSRSAIAIDNARLHRQARSAGAMAAQMNQRLVIASIREQELADEARAANASKSQFISSVTHEVRTPINAIIGYANLLELEVAGPLTDKQHHYLNRIRASSAHLLKLIEDVLDLGKVEAGRMRVREGTANARAVLSAAVGLIEPQAGEAGVIVDYQEREDAYYRGDEDRVRQILVNLLANAVKFTPRGGRVTVTYGSGTARDDEAQLAGDGPWMCIRITDTGIGIADEASAAVFQPFVQADNTITRSYGGTGLGLSISRELARLMGGDLTLRSVLGEGSTFALWLPAVGEAASGGTAPEGGGAAAG